MSDRPNQNPSTNPKTFGSSNSSLNSSSSSITTGNNNDNYSVNNGGNTGGNGGGNLNFLAAQQQQQQRGNNVRPRQGSGSGNLNSPTPDFISFLNANSSVSSQSPSNSSTSTNSNALNRLETIRQYYMQLSNNLRLITQQLQGTELTASRRQALLMEQARGNAAMQEFTEKILKPISASKQQQAQAQAQAQQQRPPFSNQPGTSQMMQYQGRPPQQAMKNTTPSSTPTANFMQQQQIQQQIQRPPQVNLYSQSGLGMIRPIINTATPAGGNRPGTAVNFRPSGPLPVPSVPQSVPPMPSGSPQRSFRPPATVYVPISQLNNAPMQTSPPTGLIPPGTPKSQQQQQQQQQQFIVNRQTYLMAAQQHQTSVAQQQLLFQQRLSLFSRDPVPAVNSPVSKKKFKGSGGRVAPVLALPPVSQINRPVSSPVRSKIQTFPATSSIPFSTFHSKLTSFPSSYPIGAKLKNLARQFKLELTEGAEDILLRIADEFIDNLARKSILFASHRKRKLPTFPAINNSNNKNNKKTSSISQTTESVDELATELTVTVEDLMLGLDEVINYQPAGNGSIENCRPLVKRAKETSNPNVNSTESSTAVTNHQHRLTMVKKHSSLYQNY